MGYQFSSFFGLLQKRKPDPIERLGQHGRDDLTTYLNYRHYDEVEKLYSLDDGIGFTIRAVPMVGISQTRFDRLNGLLGNLVPDDVTVQVTHISNNKIGNRLAQWSKRWVRDDPMFKLMNKKKREFWANHANESIGRSRTNILREHTVYISVSMENPNPEQVRELIEYRINCLSTLNTIFGYARMVEPTELITVVRALLNPTNNSIEPVFKYENDLPINEQMVRRDTSFMTDKRYIKTEVYGLPNPIIEDDRDKYDIEKQEIRCFEVSKFPSYVNFGFVSSLIGDEFDMDNGHMCPVIQCVSIYYPPAELARDTMQRNAARSKQVSEQLTGKLNVETRERAKDFERAQAAIVEGGRVVEISMFGAVMGSPEVASSAQKAARSLYQSLQFDVIYPDKVHLPMYLMCLPMCGHFGVGKFLKTFNKRHTNVSNMVSSVLPIFGEHFGTSRGGVFLAGRNGQVMEWGPFVEQGEGNNNAVVLGASGSGKSVLTAEVIVNHIAKGGAAFVIDNGYSFDKLCSIFGGVHYEFTSRSEFCLNIFDIIDEGKTKDHTDPYTGEKISGEDYLNERLELAKSVFALMIFGDRPVTAEENGVLSNVCMQVWDKYGCAGGSNEVAETILKQESESATINLKGMVNAMLPYINKGKYAKMFNGKNTLDVTNDLVVFELKPLENQKTLRDIIMAALFGIIDMKCNSNRGREDLVVIDEAWIYLYNLSLCEVMQGWARRLRKENAGLYLATQTADEMLANEFTKAILTNSQWRLVMNTPDSSVEAMAQQNLIPNEYCKRLMKDVTMVKGEYSEVMIMTDGTYYVGRLYLDSFSMALYTTSPDDVMEIRKRVQSGMNIEMALESFVMREEEKQALERKCQDIVDDILNNPLLRQRVIQLGGLREGNGLTIEARTQEILEDLVRYPVIRERVVQMDVLK